MSIMHISQCTVWDKGLVWFGLVWCGNLGAETMVAKLPVTRDASMGVFFYFFLVSSIRVFTCWYLANLVFYCLLSRETEGEVEFVRVAALENLVFFLKVSHVYLFRCTFNFIIF